MTFLASNGVQSYAQAVRDALSDLPRDQANDVLDGLDEHLAEIVAEGTIDLEGTLGSPESYAAELRASAGLPAATARTPWAAPPAASRSSEPLVIAPSDRQERNRWFGDVAGRFAGNRALLAQVVIYLALAALLAVLVRSSYPVNFIDVIFGTLVVSVAWWMLRFAGSQAAFPPAMRSHLPKVLAAAALMLAFLLGGHTATKGMQTRFNNSFEVPGVGTYNRPDGPPSTTFATIPPLTVEQAVVPRVLGQSVGEAVDLLSRIGLVAVVEGSGTSALQTVGFVSPSQGTLVQTGSIVRLAPLSLETPVTSIVTPTTAANAPVTSPAVTTVAPPATAQSPSPTSPTSTLALNETSTP